MPPARHHTLKLKVRFSVRGVIVPIPGTKRRKYLEANAAAADIHLIPAEIADLEKAVPKNAVAGERYAAEMMQTIDR